MNKLGFIETDKNVILSNYKKAKNELQNVYNKYGLDRETLEKMKDNVSRNEVI